MANEFEEMTQEQMFANYNQWESDWNALDEEQHNEIFSGNKQRCRFIHISDPFYALASHINDHKKYVNGKLIKITLDQYKTLEDTFQNSENQ